MINTLKSASTDIQSNGLTMQNVSTENPIQRPNDGWIKTSKICIHRKSNPAAWPMMMNKSEKSASTENPIQP